MLIFNILDLFHNFRVQKYKNNAGETTKLCFLFASTYFAVSINKFSLFLCLYIQNELDLICNLFIIILQKRHFTYLT